MLHLTGITFYSQRLRSVTGKKVIHQSIPAMPIPLPLPIKCGAFAFLVRPVGFGATPPPQLFIHVSLLNQNSNMENIKKFTGKDKQIGSFAKDLKKKKQKEKKFSWCEAGYQRIPLHEKDHISTSICSGKQSLVLIFRCGSVKKIS